MVDRPNSRMLLFTLWIYAASLIQENGNNFRHYNSDFSFTSLIYKEKKKKETTTYAFTFLDISSSRPSLIKVVCGFKC